MTPTDKKPSAPGFVVLHQVGDNRWEMLGEFPRKRGLTARDARTQAIHDATNGRAQPGDRYAAVLRSEWRISQDWKLP